MDHEFDCSAIYTVAGCTVQICNEAYCGHTQQQHQHQYQLASKVANGILERARGKIPSKRK